jgi:hypothetical protein
MFPFQFMDVDGTDTPVRYWGGLEGFRQITPTAWQGSLTLRYEL